jgi:hypothetical protein
MQPCLANEPAACIAVVSTEPSRILALLPLGIILLRARPPSTCPEPLEPVVLVTLGSVNLL